MADCPTQDLMVDHQSPAARNARYGSLVEGALPRRSHVRGRLAGAAVLTVAAGCAAVAFLSRPLPTKTVPPYLMNIAAHECIDWASYCKEHQICLERYHCQDSEGLPGVSPSYAIPEKRCADYYEDCRAFCTECDCPQYYCDNLASCCTERCEVIFDNLGTSLDVTPEPAFDDAAVTYGECEWSASDEGFLFQSNEMYPACPEGYKLFGVDDGGFCCKGDCPDGSEWKVNEEVCVLDSNFDNGHGTEACGSVADYATHQWCRRAMGLKEWTDYIYQADVTKTGVMAGVMFRYADPADPASPFYAYVMAEDHVAVKRFDSADAVVNLGTKRAEITNDQAYRIRIEVLGPHMKIYRDDDLEFELDDETIPAGAVGVLSYKSALQAFNMRVNGFDGSTMVGHITSYLTAPYYLSAIYVDGFQLAYPSKLKTDLHDSWPVKIPAQFSRIAVKVQGKHHTGGGCIDTPPFRQISIKELNDCMKQNGGYAGFEYFDLGTDQHAPEGQGDGWPSWSPYEALHEHVMDDHQGSIMDQICHVFGYHNFDLQTTTKQEDALPNDSGRTAVYPSANAKYDCFCETLDVSCYNDGGQYDNEACPCHANDYSQYTGHFPSRPCMAEPSAGSQYTTAYCTGGGGSAAVDFNGWAGAFVPSGSNIESGGLSITSKHGWKCADSLEYATQYNWYAKDFDVSGWPDAVEVMEGDDFELPEAISTAAPDGKTPKFIWTADQEANAVYCVYDRQEVDPSDQAGP